MKIVYVIESVLTGYWNKEQNSFKGWLFATKFQSQEEAIQQVPHACEVSACKIVPVYVSE